MRANPRRMRARRTERMATVFDLFPALMKSRKVTIGVLSGGQLRKLAFGRGLIADRQHRGGGPQDQGRLFEIRVQKSFPRCGRARGMAW